MKMLHLIPIFVILFCITNAIIYIDFCDDNYCYSDDKSPYILFGTKTAYEFVYSESNTRYGINECEPIQFWSLNRHGTRLPGPASVIKLPNLNKIKDEILNNYRNMYLNLCSIGLCAKDLILFERWTWNNTITEKLANTLTFQGWLDMEQLAKRYKLLFPYLLDIPYSRDDFLFRFTRTERTNSSFRAFAKGLFGVESQYVEGISVENDTLLEPNKYCKTWEEQVDKNPAIKIEYNKFLASPEYVEMVTQVSKRLGFDTLLNQSVIEDMFDMCRFEQSWHVKEKSTWCAAFTKYNLEILEYGEDLLYYYKTGYGMELNTKMGCLLLKNMLFAFQNVISGAKPKSIIYFTHSGSLRLLLVIMQLYKDDIPLRADNMDQQYDRLWRTSLLSPFAANFDAVLYRCNSNNEEEYNVKFFLNEHLIRLPGCMDGACSWNYIQQKYWSIAENCNLDFCNNDQ